MNIHADMDASIAKDLQIYQTLLTLRPSENPIRTIKLQFLLTSNAGLLGVFTLATDNTPLLAAGACVLNIFLNNWAQNRMALT